MRSARSVVSVLVSVLTALALATSLAGPTSAVVEHPADAADRGARATRTGHVTLSFVTHNVERKGYGRRHGNPVNPGFAVQHALAVAQAPGRPEATGIMLQEVCADEAAQFVRDHPRWTVEYHPTGPVDGDRGCGSEGTVRQGRQIGDLVAWTGGTRGQRAFYDLSPADDDVDLLGNRTQQGPGLVCVSFVRSSIPFRMCSLHMPSHGRRTGYSRRIGALTRSWQSSGYEVVVGGDFNARPQSPLLDPVFRLGGRGILQDADAFRSGSHVAHRSGGGTLTHFNRCPGTTNKIDYVFAGDARVSDDAPRRVRTFYTATPDRPADRDCYRDVADGRDHFSDPDSDHFVVLATLRFRTGPAPRS